MQSITRHTMPTTQTANQKRSHLQNDDEVTVVHKRERRRQIRLLPSRPSNVVCPALRLALQKKTLPFHLTLRTAERAGFRACKRCQPKGLGFREEQAKAVARACALIETSEELPDLETRRKRRAESVLLPSG